MQLAARTFAAAVATCLPVAVNHAGAQTSPAPADHARPATHAVYASAPIRRPLPRVFYHASVEQAWQTAAVRKRPLLVMFTSDHCRYCTKMFQETYGHPSIQQILAMHAETVVAHARDNKALIERLGVRAYPTSLIVSPEGKIVGAIEGFVEPQVFAQRVAPLLMPSPPLNEPSTGETSAQQVAAANPTR